MSGRGNRQEAGGGADECRSSREVGGVAAGEGATVAEGKSAGEATGAGASDTQAGSPPALRAVPADLTARIVRVVSEALDRDPGEITVHSSLIDDLGAESIDFMDIVFRLEDDLGVQISDDDLWRGAFPPGELTPEILAAGVETLRQRLPEFRWDRFPNGVSPRDLPRLATVSTIVSYLDRELPRLPPLAQGHARG